LNPGWAEIAGVFEGNFQMDKEFLEELFAPFGNIKIKNMFGGTGIFHRNLNFAGIMDGQFRLIPLKNSSSNGRCCRPEFCARVFVATPTQLSLVLGSILLVL